MAEHKSENLNPPPYAAGIDVPVVGQSSAPVITPERLFLRQKQKLKVCVRQKRNNIIRSQEQ